ncbi:MAG TPA: hypothetical protein PKC20_19120, partial [Burkholderiaceae bacterium]|nr:hypothetical protein [Burkholderiaceae bacterium]
MAAPPGRSRSSVSRTATRSVGAPGERWSAGIAVEGALGTDANRDNLRNNDVETSDDVNLDQAW